MTAELYQASPIKRARATKAEVEARREALLDIIEAGRPMTVRQVFYQATVRRGDASRLRASQTASSVARSGRASASQFVLWRFRSCAPAPTAWHRTTPTFASNGGRGVH